MHMGNKAMHQNWHKLLMHQIHAPCISAVRHHSQKNTGRCFTERDYMFATICVSNVDNRK